MNRNILIGIVVAGVLALGVGIWGYNRLQGDTIAASGPITAIPLATGAPATGDTTAPTAAPVTGDTTAPTAVSVASNAAVPTSEIRFQIVPEESKVSFVLQEDLRGQRIEVVGTTDQVAGEIAINPSDLSSAKIGVIQINARTLVTNDERRNRAIKNFILETNTHEFITFTPKSIEGLSGSGVANAPVTFKISGDLTIRNVTIPVVFEATVTAESADRLVGSASTVVNRSDFKLTIPSVPMVANVSEEVTLKLDFVARVAA